MEWHMRKPSRLSLPSASRSTISMMSSITLFRGFSNRCEVVVRASGCDALFEQACMSCRSLLWLHLVDWLVQKAKQIMTENCREVVWHVVHYFADRVKFAPVAQYRTHWPNCFPLLLPPDAGRCSPTNQMCVVSEHAVLIFRWDEIEKDTYGRIYPGCEANHV